MSLRYEQASLWRRFKNRRKAKRSIIRDASPDAVNTIERSLPYSMTSWPRLLGLVEATEYVARNDIPGAIVECGVWKGGSMFAAALTLVKQGKTERDLYLLDTFEGMPGPGERDVTNSGKPALETWKKVNEGEEGSDWCRAGVNEVRVVMESSGFPKERIHYIVGMVERTIPERAPEEIALLRLDTDWYESTKHELIHLWPRLSIGGVLILDDYGSWRGAREAVDEYFGEHRVPVLLQRLDKAGRIAVKIG